MIARQVFYEGRVQGVGFRFTCKQLARGYDVVGWFGVLAQGRTPAPVLRKLHTEVVRIVGQPSVKTLYAAAGLQVATSGSPAEFDEFIRKVRDKWAKVIKAANIRIE